MSAFITFLPLDSIESETMRHNFYSCSLLISAAISQRKITFSYKKNDIKHTLSHRYSYFYLL